MTPAEAMTRIGDDLTSRVCRGMDSATSEWCAQTLRDTIVPSLVDDSFDPDDEDVADITAHTIAQLDAESADARYANVVLKYFQTLLGPISREAYSLARAVVFDGVTSPSRADELLGELNTFISLVDDTAPALADDLRDPIEQTFLDIAYAGGEAEATSRRVQIDLTARDELRAEHARVGDPDPEIDRLASQARAALASSFEAAKIAADTEIGTRDQMLEIRHMYDFALDVLEGMEARFGPDAVRRVSNDLTRADLIDTLGAPILPGEWEEDSSTFGILSTRLSRRC